MLTAACLTLLFATLALTAWCGYDVGRARRPRSESYLAARASGWRDRGVHEEAARAALRRQLDEVTADRDRLDAALEEYARLYDQGVARRFVPEIVRTVPGAEVYDHQEAGL